MGIKKKVEIKRIAVNTPKGRIGEDVPFANYKVEGWLSKDEL